MPCSTLKAPTGSISPTANSGTIARSAGNPRKSDCSVADTAARGVLTSAGKHLAEHSMSAGLFSPMLAFIAHVPQRPPGAPWTLRKKVIDTPAETRGLPEVSQSSQSSQCGLSLSTVGVCEMPSWCFSVVPQQTEGESEEDALSLNAACTHHLHQLQLATWLMSWTP